MTSLNHPDTASGIPPVVTQDPFLSNSYKVLAISQNLPPVFWMAEIGKGLISTPL